jgi:hypothetical protein
MKKNLERNMFPHESALITLEESGAEALTTEENHDFLKDAKGKRVRNVMAKLGNIIVVVPPGWKSRWTKLNDEEDKVPNAIPDVV